MSFADPDTIINAVIARSAGVEPAGMDELISGMMGITNQEIRKAMQNNANLPQEEFTAGCDAMLAHIENDNDTTNNPKLAKAIADYRAAPTEAARDAVKPNLLRELEQSAQEHERAARDIPKEAKAAAAEHKCSRYMDCNCDNRDCPLNQLLHDSTDHAIDDAIKEVGLNLDAAKVKQISDRKRLDYFRDHIKTNNITILEIFEQFIKEGCRGFSWKFLIALPEFEAEIPKFYKCRYPECQPIECMVCACYLHNSGWITTIRHQELVPVEHYPSIMTQIITEAVDTNKFTNLDIIYSHFRNMPNFARYNEIFKTNVKGSPESKNKNIERWLNKH